MSSENGAARGNGGGVGGEVTLLMLSRRLTRSLVAMPVGGRMSFYGCHSDFTVPDLTQQL